MLSHLTRWPLLLVVSIILVGCDPGQPGEPDLEEAPPAGLGPAPPADHEPAPVEVEEEVEVEEPAPEAEPPADDVPADSPAEETESAPDENDQAAVRQRAEAGVGLRGRDLPQGLVSTPVKAYFTARERVVFDVQIPSAMNLYKAEHGRGPRTHDEFMDKIVKPNGIRLPDLPAGHKYVYDAEKEELMVEHP